MSVEIRTVSSKGDLRRFIRFGWELYRDSPYAVPALYTDELNVLRPDRNPAYDFCQAELFLAYRDDRIVGRVAAIINDRTNERWNEKAVRFGWLDFIDDREVSGALLETVAEWGRKRGMDKIHGPLGFVDFDREGMLVDGFDQLATMSTLYNYPYYPQHLEQMGYTKELGWIEMRIKVPEQSTERHTRLCAMVQQRYGLDVVRGLSTRELRDRYGKAFFELLNEGYKDIHGYSTLSDRQIKWYIEKYFSVIDPRMVCFVTNKEDRLVGLGISMPSLSVALQKARGRFLPLGWWHLLKALTWHRPDTLDLLLVAVAPEFRSKGVSAILLNELCNNYIKLGYKWGETTLELEDNENVQSMWGMYDRTVHKRHTLYFKNL